MKIAVIAAQGRSGQAFVREALAAGHTVRAGIRGESPFALSPSQQTVECDATDKTQVTHLVDTCDAVVSLIGHVKGSDEFVQTKATKAIITAMETAGVTRFVSLTGAGVWVPGDRLKALIDGTNALAAKMGVKRVNDGIKHVEVLTASKLQFTVLRVLLLNGGEPGTFKLKAHGIPKVPTPRREVARAILDILEHERFFREYPVITRG